MPSNDIQWLWFAFFALGSLGGLAFFVVMVRDLITTIRIARARGRMND